MDKLVWNENKRQYNLLVHGLDVADAHWVLESRIRLDLPVVRNNEQRIQAFSYVMVHLAVLTLVHVPRDDAVRIISFRHASEEESGVYYAWLKNEYNEG